MSAIETIAVKLKTGDYPFQNNPMELKLDPRTGLPSPWVIRSGAFLSDLRAQFAQKPPEANHAMRRDRARHLHFDMYEWTCPEHGETAFHTVSGRCTKCARKAPVDSSYTGHCPIHGEGPFSSARRLCLGCYNTLGKPRPVSTNPAGFYVGRDGKFIECPE